MDCDHIIGREEGADEEWLVYRSEGWLFGEDGYGNIIFNYCPICGEKL